MDYDGFLTIPSPLPNGLWTQPSYTLRGGYRYLSIASSTSSSVSFSNVSCDISFAPNMEDLRAYEGYFHASDNVGYQGDMDFLNKLWYSGAYTVQTNSIGVNTGRSYIVASPGA